MTNPSIFAGMTRKAEATAKTLATFAPMRRAGHGGRAWSVPVELEQLLQPQDGAPQGKSKVAAIRTKMQGADIREPEDAKLTGGTRSLTRRLLGLNFGLKQRKPLSAVQGTFTKTQIA